MNKFIFFVLFKILYCAYSRNSAGVRNCLYPKINGKSHYEWEQTVKVLKIVKEITNKNGCAGLMQYLKETMYKPFKSTFTTSVIGSIMFVIDNKDFKLLFVHQYHKQQESDDSHLFKIDINIDPLALCSCVELFGSLKFYHMKAVIKTHTGIQEYLPNILNSFNYIIKLDLQVDHITDETMQKLSTLKLQEFHIDVAKLKFEHLRNFLNFRSQVMEIIAESLQIDSSSQITPIILNKICHKCVIKIQDHSLNKFQDASTAPESSYQHNVAEIVLSDLDSLSYERRLEFGLNSTFFHPIYGQESTIKQLTLIFEDESRVNDLLQRCICLKFLNLKLKKIMKDFSFIESESLYPTLQYFKISVTEDVNFKAQSLSKLLQQFKCLRNIKMRINFSNSNGKNVFNELLIPSLESLTIDSNALCKRFFKNGEQLCKLEDVDINWPTNFTTDHTMTVLKDLTMLPELTELILDRISNIHEWQMLENCEDLSLLKIKAPIDFPLTMNVGSRLRQTLKDLFISLDVSIIQNVCLIFIKLELLSLEITSKNNDRSVNNEAVHCFMRENFTKGINETLENLTLRQSTSFDLTPLSGFYFPKLTRIRLEISDSYERGQDEQFCNDFYARMSKKRTLLGRVHFIFKCSHRELEF